jgi:hypothetical protein
MTNPAVHSGTPSLTSETRGRLHIYVLIDALGWQFVNGRDFLTDLLSYRRPLRTVLGFSSGAIPTILTGLPPSRTGHWNLFYYDPAKSPFRWLRLFRFLPKRVMDHRITRKIVKELGRRVLGMGPLFECCVSPALLPWFNWVEKKNIYGPDGIPGSESIFDLLARKEVPHRVYSYHTRTDKDILRQASDDLQSRAAEFFFLYLSEMDLFLHNHCNDQAAVSDRLTWYQEQLKQLFERALRIDPGASFTIVSDHGMTPVQSTYDLVADIDSLGYRMPQDYLAVYDSTMARFWCFQDDVRNNLIARLRAIPHGRILEDQELDGLGILFPNRRYGEIIFLMDPGCLLSHSDFNGRGWMPLGMHGYHPDDPYSDAVFLSNKRPTTDMKSIADIYGCMRQTVPTI